MSVTSHEQSDRHIRGDSHDLDDGPWYLLSARRRQDLGRRSVWDDLFLECGGNDLYDFSVSLWQLGAHAAEYLRPQATYYGHLYHDFTREIRAGLETIGVRTTYADGAHAENRRVQLSFFWRF